MQPTLESKTTVPMVLAMVALTCGIILAILLLNDTLERIGSWGYAGAFLIMMLNSATIVLPAFGHAVIAGLANTLNPVLLGIIGGVGAALGELTGYVLGHAGGRMVRATRAHTTLRLVMRRWTGPALFVFAATPLPFDIAGVLAGAVHYPVWRFLAAVTAGKIIGTTVVAVGSYHAIGWIERLIDWPG